jgi:Zn-dependent M28 family amino/carboxypeptidase
MDMVMRWRKGRQAVFLAGVVLCGVWLCPAAEVGLLEENCEKQLQTTVQELAAFGDRNVGAPGNKAVALYLQKKLAEFGLDVVLQGGDLQNVVGLLKGTNAMPREVLIVGAHYDSVTNSPGATDNGAGVAIVLEQARLLSRMSFAYDIKFAFWNGEEIGGKGSRAYVKEAVEKKEPIALYLNYDSVGFDKGQCLLDLMYNSLSEKVAQRVVEINERQKMGYTLTQNTKKCFSDHRPFRDAGFCALMFHCSEHGPAHTPKDTPDQVSTAYAWKNAKLGLILLSEWASPEKVAAK